MIYTVVLISAVQKSDCFIYIYIYIYICSFSCSFPKILNTVQFPMLYSRGFPGGSLVKNLPANAGDTGDVGSIPGSGRFPCRIMWDLRETADLILIVLIMPLSELYWESHT